MKSHFIVKNGQRETGEMSVFEAVDIFEKFKSIGTEEDVFEIHSFCKKWCIKVGGKLNKAIIFNSMEDALEYASGRFWNFDVVEVREFMLWFRGKHGKDYKEFWTDALNLADAVDEAMNALAIHVFAVTYDNETVAKYNINLVRYPDRR